MREELRVAARAELAAHAAELLRAAREAERIRVVVQVHWRDEPGGRKEGKKERNEQWSEEGRREEGSESASIFCLLMNFDQTCVRILDPGAPALVHTTNNHYVLSVHLAVPALGLVLPERREEAADEGRGGGEEGHEVAPQRVLLRQLPLEHRASFLLVRPPPTPRAAPENPAEKTRPPKTAAKARQRMPQIRAKPVSATSHPDKPTSPISEIADFMAGLDRADQ